MLEQFDQLILIMGTNPLPNFVVAEYFLNNNPDLKKVWLVYSEKNSYQEGTYTYAEYLETVLKNRHSNKPIFPLNKIAISNVSSAKQILIDIKKKLVDSLPSSSSVHLNYTGGTKVMGNHVYRAIEHDQSKNLSKSFSYLDGRNFRIIRDEDGMIFDDLRDEVSIEFEELIKLHGFKRINVPLATPKNQDCLVEFAEVVNKFKTLIDNNMMDDYYNIEGGYNRVYFEDEKGSLANKLKDLNQASRDKLNNFIAKPPFLDIVQALPENYRLFDKQGRLVLVPDDIYKKVIKFLDGGWFEEYIYETIKNKFKSANIRILKNWEIKKEIWREKDYFQLDVILMKGYQLMGISCTTDKKKDLCKSKGFEIIHRVRQIGGDEAKAVLVTRMNDEIKNDLQEELEIDTGGTSKNILVLGSSDWKEDCLIAKIAGFVKED